ncbi:diacylglycerol/lipid kinase family protein [Bizionia sp. KMM 8389]
MKILIVVNPISGDVDKEPFLSYAISVCSKYAISYDIFKTTGENDAENLKKQIKSYKPDRIASVGGDGTTLFTAVTLLDSGIPMGIVPLGSANGMAMELSVDKSPKKAFLDIIMSQVIGNLDMLLINKKHHAIHIGDVGLNAKIVEAYENDSNRGMATYAKYFVEQLQQNNPFPMSITTDNEKLETKGLMLGICNARKYGTGVPLNKTGNPMDGIFELVIISKIDATSLLKAGLSKFDESFHDSENIQVIKTTKATIDFKNSHLLQLDGEVIGSFKTLDIEILPAAIKLITTTNNSYL